jgi:hypothetical protein
MAGLIQNLIVLKQLQGNIATYCRSCKKRISYSQFDDDGSYTKKCGCGCEVNRFHKADQFHNEPYYLKTFISKKQFNPNYKKLDEAEKQGFKKIETNKGVMYVK